MCPSVLLRATVLQPYTVLFKSSRGVRLLLESSRYIICGNTLPSILLWFEGWANMGLRVLTHAYYVWLRSTWLHNISMPTLAVLYINILAVTKCVFHKLVELSFWNLCGYNNIMFPITRLALTSSFGGVSCSLVVNLVAAKSPDIFMERPPKCMHDWGNTNPYRVSALESRVAPTKASWRERKLRGALLWPRQGMSLTQEIQ